jgi:hypothetical protein
MEHIKNALFYLRMVHVNAATFHQCFWFQILALISYNRTFILFF